MAGRSRRLLSFALAFAAIAVVVWAVPFRDRCWDPQAPKSTRISISRSDTGCVLHAKTGDVSIEAESCARLRCEPGAVSTLTHARLDWIAALLAAYCTSTLFWSARWRALLGFAGIDLRLREVWRITVEAQAGGVFLPGGVGSDALRIASVVAHPSRSERTPALVIASVLLDRFLGLSLIAGLASVLGFIWGGAVAGAPVVALAAIPTGFLLGLVLLRKAPLDRVGWLARGRIADVVAPVLAYARDRRAPRAVALAVAFGTVVATIQLAVVRGLVAAVGASPTEEKWVYIGATMAFIVSAIPALPGGWGTADAAYVFFFGLAGIAPGAALGVCLLFRLFWYTLAVIGATLYVVRTRSPAPEQAVPPTHS